MLLGSPCKNSEFYNKSFLDIFEITPFSDQNRVNSGGRGSPQFFLKIGIFLLMLLRSLRKFFEISLFSNQNRVKLGGRGGPQIFFLQFESYYLCCLGAPTKIWNPMISLSGIYLKIAHFPVKIGLIRGLAATL